jgi:hypothetical protein
MKRLFIKTLLALAAVAAFGAAPGAIKERTLKMGLNSPEKATRPLPA